MFKNKYFVIFISLILVFIFALTVFGKDSDLPEVNWTIQTTWTQGWLLHDMAIDMAERVRVMSGGKFNIEVLPAGAVVGGLEVLDATVAGAIDGYHSWPGYWMGKHPSAPFFASIPMGLEPQMHIMWLYAGGGNELLQRMYDEINLPIVAMPCGVTHPEVLAHSNKALYDVEDFKGLKYRAPGWWGEILKDMGVSVTMLPGTELYPSLEKGVLDATEFSSPTVNYQSGFHEVTDYVAGPGMHQPTCFFEVGFYKPSYEALPDEYKAMIESATMASTLWSWSTGTVNDMKILKEWKEMGKTFTRVNTEAQHEFREKAWNWMEADVKAMNNAHYTECWESVKNFYNDFVEFEDFMVPVRPIDK